MRDIVRLVIFALLAKTGLASKIFLIHQSHEGSHAMCEAMKRLVCVPVNCKEVYDSKGVLDFDALSQTDGVVLIRADMKDLRRLNATDAYVVMARTDNVRWTLSQYYKWNFQSFDNDILGEYKDPQFNQTMSGPPEPREIDMNLLARAAAMCKLAWTQKLELLDWMKIHERNYAVAVYEQFVQSEHDYLRGVLRHIGEYDEKCDRTDDEAYVDKSYIHKVHSGGLEEYASNVDDILQFFSTNFYPSWAECCGRYHGKAHPKALPRPVRNGHGCELMDDCDEYTSDSFSRPVF